MKGQKELNIPDGCELMTIHDLHLALRNGEAWEFFLSLGRDADTAMSRKATVYRTDDWDGRVLDDLLGETPSGLVVVARKVEDHG